MCLHETKSCGRCQSSFECKVGNISQCQCNGISLTDEERTYLSTHYSDCLCRNCLLEIKREIRHKQQNPSTPSA
ncbi:MAG TPA: cysteine-rich CWC family protein [Puia sp.]